ncbi:DNA-processing protein DprA [Corynebacterium xerosis]|uniref:DNA-protecting protein DprA n=1 Tax=Corynebacterium xerosis TaxID=1725 RepID=A0A7X9XSR1_9CORY|nr:DNA-processing protein DprA [Corynebacterium xerosis]NMF08386.1 DNA-protecting protein DprA [Corynebacterium xerosis]
MTGPADDRARRAWAYLARVVEGPHPALNRMLGEVGPEAAAERIRRRSGLPRELAGATESRHHLDQADEDLALAARHGFRLVTAEDEEWPVEAIQHFLGSTAVGNDAAPPYALWVRGGRLDSLFGDAVAMVGTRAATSYGARMTERLASGVARAGATIVSGGALGIDAVAHRTALEVGGRTVAVAACGPGVDYPAAHADLFRRIGEGGAIVTEYPPGIRPARHRFLTRNRLVAGLTGATVLVEAGWRSGARNTAAWARQMNRPVAAVPGPATSASSTGCHDAIREGGAVLVTGPDHVLALYRGLGSVDEDAQMELDWAADPVQALSRNELRVYDSTPRPGEPGHEGGADTATIAAEAALTLPLTMHLLMALEGKGMVVRDGSMWRRRNR